MIVNIKKTIIPCETFEPLRHYLLYDELENNLAFGVGGWLVENHFDELENEFNGSVDRLMEVYDDKFWKELKRRAMEFFDIKFIGWCSVDKEIFDFLRPLEIWRIDHYFSKISDIDFTSHKPIEIIMYFESLEDIEEEKNWDYDPDNVQI